MQPVWDTPKTTSTPSKDSKSGRGQKIQDALKRDVPLKLIGQFGSHAHYLRLLEGVRSSYTNYQLNLDFEGMDKFSLLLGNALNCLAALLEVSTFQDIAKVWSCVLLAVCVGACGVACLYVQVMCLCVCACVRACVCICVHACVCVCVCAYVHACVRVCVCMLCECVFHVFLATLY